MQKLLVFGLWATGLAAGVLQAATLQQLSLDDMIQKSTVIVRGRTQLSYASFEGRVIYTHYTVHVSEAMKGTQAKQLDIVVPGGVSSGLRQRFAGAPVLVDGQDYVLFLWTSKTGLTQVIGLSQGLFSVVPNSSGQPMVVRAASTERMLNAAGQPISDSDIQMPLGNLRSQIQSVLAGGKP